MQVLYMYTCLCVSTESNENVLYLFSEADLHGAYLSLPHLSLTSSFHFSLFSARTVTITTTIIILLITTIFKPQVQQKGKKWNIGAVD